MCLGIPGQVVEMAEGYHNQLVWVDVVGARRKVNLGMLEDADQAAIRPGDWVLLHMGFVVQRIDQAAAQKAMSGLEMMGRASEDADRADLASGEQWPRVG
ncbi:MAG: HypC/HybG/HupF family hydrogenase formation chaperone [Pseudonocardiales bacterium]